MAADDDALHVTYGDDLAEALRAAGLTEEPLVVREALHDGPLVPSPNEDMAAFVAARARHLARVHGADEAQVRLELEDAWQRLATHAGPVVLHVDEAPCIDCAAFLALALDVLHRSGRSIAKSDTGIEVMRGADPSTRVELEPSDVAAGAGAWRLVVAGDDSGLTLAAADIEGTGGMNGMPELPGLLVRRAQGDVPPDELRPT